MLALLACRTNQSNAEANPELTKGTSSTNSTEKNNIRTPGVGGNAGGNSKETAPGKDQVSGQPASQSGNNKK
jgi:hypothetical protein